MKMFNQIPLTTFDVLSSIGLSLGIIVLTLVIFAWFWLSTTDFYMPKGDYHDKGATEEDLAEGRVKLDTTWSYFKALLKRLFDLDPWYWTRYSGFECRFF